ncbi:hypothetical protein AA3271_1582 [Gluconobacter japonicus NBRC 3271]|nr:hypothetical protein AA3271_1582 [Gluconobacter japonicus NBRC 3271]
MFWDSLFQFLIHFWMAQRVHYACVLARDWCQESPLTQDWMNRKDCSGNVGMPAE